MRATTFDTHDAANRFKAAGFTEDQVEALADVARRTTAPPDISTLATKSDLTELWSELKTEIASVRTLIACTQVQTVTVILTAVGAMLVLSRLIPGSIH